MNDFTKKVLDVVAQIPRGKVCAYSDIAHALGCSAYRAVGTALQKNQIPVEIPCHRVVNADGRIGGYFGVAQEKVTKRKLLESEGITFSEKKGTLVINNFQSVRHQFDI